MVADSQGPARPHRQAVQREVRRKLLQILISLQSKRCCISTDCAGKQINGAEHGVGCPPQMAQSPGSQHQEGGVDQGGGLHAGGEARRVRQPVGQDRAVPARPHRQRHQEPLEQHNAAQGGERPVSGCGRQGPPAHATAPLLPGASLRLCLAGDNRDYSSPQLTSPHLTSQSTNHSLQPESSCMQLFIFAHDVNQLLLEAAMW